jgi:hypothetical protein
MHGTARVGYLKMNQQNKNEKKKINDLQVCVEHVGSDSTSQRSEDCVAQVVSAI